MKRRIASSHGHLSNQAAARLATELLHPRLACVVLAHLSFECNRPILAERVVGDALRKAGWSVYYVPTASGTHFVGVSRAGRRLGSVLDFHASAYRYYRKHHQASALHPLTVLVGAGLLASLALRSVQALWASDR